MNSIKKTARIAGLLYLLLTLSGLFGMMYVPSKIFTGGDAAAIVNNIKSHEFLFLSGIVGKLICQVSFVFFGTDVIPLV